MSRSLPHRSQRGRPQRLHKTAGDAGLSVNAAIVAAIEAWVAAREAAKPKPASEKGGKERGR